MLINDTLHTTSPLRQRIRDYYRISESVAVDQILPIAEVNPRARSRAWERARKMVLDLSACLLTHSHRSSSDDALATTGLSSLG